jgi:hypothetical protein
LVRLHPDLGGATAFPNLEERSKPFAAQATAAAAAFDELLRGYTDFF